MGSDAGVDLVAEDRQGNLWAVQTKAYSSAVAITKRDVDRFLAESGRPEFKFRLLIATTDLIGQTAKRTLEGQERQASVLLLSDLEAAQVEWEEGMKNLGEFVDTQGHALVPQSYRAREFSIGRVGRCAAA